MTSAISSQGQTSSAANRDKIIPAFFKAKSIFEPVIKNRTNRYIFINKCYHLLTCPEGEVSLKARYI
jgi:hypothetical protein